MAQSAFPLELVYSVAVGAGYGLKGLYPAERTLSITVLLCSLDHTLLAHQYRTFLIVADQCIDSIFVAYLADSVVLIQLERLDRCLGQVLLQYLLGEGEGLGLLRGYNI